jgi:hypothetical protein
MRKSSPLPASFLHVDFREASVDTFSDPEPFDLVIGRYFLLHQADPIGFLKAAARFAPGGKLVLHEPISGQAGSFSAACRTLAANN